MKNFCSIKLEPFMGTTIDNCIKEAIELAEFTNDCVEFEFNDVNVMVDRNSNVSKVYENYYSNLTNR